MRIAYAWLLLIIALLSWVGGILCLEVSYHVEIRHEMNAMEEAIAEAIHQKIGMESSVQLLDEQNVLPKGYIYGNYFPFATELDNGQRVYYKIVDSTELFVYQFNNNDINEPFSDNDKTLLLKSIFQESIITNPIFIEALAFYLPNVFALKSSNYLSPDPFLQTPPPDLLLI